MTDAPTLLLSNEELYDLIVVGLLNSNERLVLLGDARITRALLAQALAALELVEQLTVKETTNSDMEDGCPACDASAVFGRNPPHYDDCPIGNTIAALRAAGVEHVK